MNGKRTSFEITRNDPWRDDFMLKLRRGGLFRGPEKFGIVTHVFPSTTQHHLWIQFTTFEVTEEGDILIETAEVGLLEAP